MMSVSSNSTDKRLNPIDVTNLSDEDQQINTWMRLVAEQQDKAAFAQLFKWFTPKIKAHGMKRFRQEAQALELVQETMLLVWRKAALFNPDKGKATTWVYTVMRNHCFDMLRKMQSQKEDTMSDDLWPMLECDHSSGEQHDHLMSRELLSHIESLPQQQKLVVEAIYIKEMTQQELATHLGVPLGTVKSRLRLAMSKLKSKLEASHD
ncbi:sigma-70 family RNA polymerase sigma factor [Motilimonas pumila]|nr:sigma-70 family RNA polymerase sigma factor [Motilimonas pumila]